jgi:hypothetical protein
MKQFFSMLMLGGTLSLAAQPASTDINWTPTVTFEQTTHDFGGIPEGPVATYEFMFTNTGKDPILVQTAQASCGCTTPEWPRTPVAPGKTANIKVGYNSEGRPGAFTKDVTVTFVSGTNQDKTGTTKLTIKGNVNGKDGSVTPTKGNVNGKDGSTAPTKGKATISPMAEPTNKPTPVNSPIPH